METILLILITFIAWKIIMAQMLQKIEDKERYPGVNFKYSKRGNLYTRVLRAVIPKSIK